MPFAFMLVRRAADGNHLYTSPGNQTVTVGVDNVDILVVYAPAGGGNGPPGVPGVSVDAVNVDTGEFSDSDFIQVSANGVVDNAATNEANNNGDVSSVIAEDLLAASIVDGIPFSEWKKIGGSELNSRGYKLARNETGFLFAFYQTPPVDPLDPCAKERADLAFFMENEYIHSHFPHREEIKRFFENRLLKCEKAHKLHNLKTATVQTKVVPWSHEPMSSLRDQPRHAHVHGEDAERFDAQSETIADHDLEGGAR